MRCSRLSPAFASAAVAALGAFGAVSWPSTASAFCRAVSATPPAGYDPTTLGCFGYAPDGGVSGGLFPLFWRNECVSYSFQSAPNKSLTLDQAKDVANKAFSAWSGAACPGGPPSITAVLFPEVSCEEVPSAGHNNVIIFRDDQWPYPQDAANAIGFTTLTIDTTTGEILGADTEINSANWTIVAEPPAPANGYDFATIMTHEAGHFLGLAHSSDASAVMYAKYHPATALQPDDVAAICSIYDPSGTHNTIDGPIAALACNPTPLAGFMSVACGSFDSGIVNLTAIGTGSGVNLGELKTACADPSGCATGGRSSVPWGAGLLIGGLVAAGAMVRLGRRGRARSGVIGVSLLAIGGAAAGSRDAQASVSAAALFDDLVKQSSAAALVTPLEQRGDWEGNRIVTKTHVRVDRLIAGALPGDLWIRTLGGSVGHIGQIVEGQATFTPGVTTLLFLQPRIDPATKAPTDAFAVVGSAQGEYPVVTREGSAPRLGHAPNLGAIVPPPGSEGARFAREVLEDRPVEDVAREIAESFRRSH
jgi:hypothetical protein